MKTCSKCKVEKTLDNFTTGKKFKDGKNPWCRSCHTEYQASYRRKKPRPPNNPYNQREWQLKRRYGITTEQYNQKLAEQDNKCAVCKADYIEGGRNFHVDHNHLCCSGDTGCGNCIRGILCHGCNVALGLVKDDVETLRAMISYLEQA